MLVKGATGKQEECNSLWPLTTKWSQAYWSTLVQVGAKPLLEAMVTYCQLDLMKKLPWNSDQNTKFSFRKMHFEILPVQWKLFCLGINALNTSSPFYSEHSLTLITAWISNHMLNKVWDEITYPSSNCNSCTFEVWEWICNRPVSQIRAPPGSLSRTSGKLWQDYSNCYMLWT